MKSAAAAAPMRERSITRDEVLHLLRTHKEVLFHDFRVVTLTLFGSVARDEASEKSDIDIMVSFEGPTTFNGFFGTQFYLEDALGHPVDLVTSREIRPELRLLVDRDAIVVWTGTA